MKRPTTSLFNEAVIAELRRLAVAHNGTPGNRLVKLNDLKHQYRRGWSGKDAAIKAMSKVHAFLGAHLAKADDPQPPSDPEFESQHPRADDGTFTDKAGGASAAPSAPSQPSAPKPAPTPAIVRSLPATQAEHRQDLGRDRHPRCPARGE